jgi:hypothetical protein
MRKAMVAAAEASGLPNMIGFNYVRTPATQFVRQLLGEGAIGRVTWFRGEHTEDFLADPDAARDMAHDGAGEWHDGRSGTASDQLPAGADGAGGRAFGADRDGACQAGPKGRWRWTMTTTAS